MFIIKLKITRGRVKHIILVIHRADLTAMEVENFVSKTLELLQEEREAELEETR